MSFSLLTTELPKKRSIIKRFPVLIPLMVFVLLVIGYQLLDNTFISPAVGIIQINGVILDSEPTIKKLRSLESDPAILGIIVHINSPGGAVAPSQEIYSEILRIKQKKKVYASISSTAASGGYYIAIAAEKLFANPGSMIGSIGVIIQTFNIKGLMDKLGIESEVIKAGKNKDVGTIFRKMKSEEKELLENVVNDTHHQFISAVATNRGLPYDQVKKIADGRVFTGNQAKEIGLIDQIASFRETVDQFRQDLKVETPIQLVYPSDKEDFWGSLLDLKSIFGIQKIVAQPGLYYLTTSLID